MAPKKKTITAIGSSRAGLPVPAQTGDMVDAGGGGDQDHPHHSGMSSQASSVIYSRNDDPRNNEKLSHAKP